MPQIGPMAVDVGGFALEILRDQRPDGTRQKTTLHNFGKTANTRLDSIAFGDRDGVRTPGWNVDFEAVRVGGFGTAETGGGLGTDFSAGIPFHRLLLHLTGRGIQFLFFEKRFQVVAALKQQVFDAQ